MEIYDPFENAAMWNLPKAAPIKNDEPKKFEELISAGPSDHQEKETSLGEKASGLFNKIASKVGSLLDTRTEETKAKEEVKQAKKKMFIIDDEATYLNHEEHTSPSRKIFAKGDIIDKDASFTLIPFKNDSMLSFFTKVIFL